MLGTMTVKRAQANNPLAEGKTILSEMQPASLGGIHTGDFHV